MNQYDQNAALSNDITYLSYSQPPPPAPIPVVQGGTTVITTINGGGGGQATGPSITIGSNWAGVNFVANGSDLNLDIQNPVSARGALGAAAAGVNTDITELNGASQVDVSSRYEVAGTKVVGAQQPAVPDPTGGVTIDVEARAQLILLLQAARAHGLIA